MIEITARQMEGGTGNEHIAEVRYKNADGAVKTASRKAMVAWFDKSDSNKAIVYSRDRKSRSYVGVVHRQNAPDYIRTYADRQWNDNLLSLPTY